jgi:hypothetical protein
MQFPSSTGSGELVVDGSGSGGAVAVVVAVVVVVAVSGQSQRHWLSSVTANYLAVPSRFPPHIIGPDPTCVQVQVQPSRSPNTNLTGPAASR